MIPTFEEFFYPFMKSLGHSEITLNDLQQYLINHFKLSPEDLNIKTRGGNTTQFRDRINWSRQYLRRAGFIELPKRGVYKITQRGIDYMSSHSDLRSSDLMQYPEFSAFSLGGNKESTQEDITIVPSLMSSCNNTVVVTTPTETLDSAFHDINESLAEELLTQIKSQSPAFFEKLVVDLLVKMGYGGSDNNSALVTRYSMDDGIDGIIKEDKLGLDSIYIQAKRWENTVGQPDIQKFVGALSGQGANKGVFITTSCFSQNAKNYHANGIKLVLIDGKELTKLMIEYNVGVSVKKTYEVKRLDLDYFEE